MKLVLVICFIILQAVSLLLAVRLLRSSNHWLEKIGGCVLVFVPLIGPLLYLFVIEPPPPKPPWLQARGARGDYTDRWIASREALEETLNQVRRSTTSLSAMDDATDGKRSARIGEGSES